MFAPDVARSLLLSRIGLVLFRALALCLGGPAGFVSGKTQTSQLCGTQNVCASGNLLISDTLPAWHVFVRRPVMAFA